MRTALQGLMIVLFLDVLVFLTQVAMVEINPAATVFFEFEGSDVSQFDKGDFVLQQDLSEDLPETGNPVAVSLGSNVFTDTFSTIKNWLLNIPGAKHLLMIVNSVPTWIKYFGFPAEISFAVGLLWHGITFLLVVIFIK